MAQLHPLSAEPRKILGRKVKQLRNQGLLPANVFGSKIKSQAIKLDQKDFIKTYQQVGDTGLIDLKIQGDKEARPVLVHLVQIHPVNDQPLHVDFRQVDLKEKILANVPIELVGESPAAEQKGGILVHVMDEIEVEALPTDLPDKFELDISSLNEIGDSLHVSDIKVDIKKVVLQAEPGEVVAHVEAPKEEEEEVKPAEEASAEGAAESDSREAAKPAEGEQPAAEVKAEGETSTEEKAEAAQPDQKPETEKSDQ